MTTELHPSRQEISIFRAIPAAQSNRLCSLRPAVCAVICFGAIALGSVTRSFAQGTPPQTQNQTQPSAQTPPDAPSASKPPKSQSGIPGSDTYNLLRKKSLFFPNIATSTERLSPGGKFKLFVDNSISMSTILFAAGSSGVSQAFDSPTGYEQGWDAYGKRFGSYMARNSSAVLEQEPPCPFSVRCQLVAKGTVGRHT